MLTEFVMMNCAVCKNIEVSQKRSVQRVVDKLAVNCGRSESVSWESLFIS